MSDSPPDLNEIGRAGGRQKDMVAAAASLLPTLQARASESDELTKLLHATIVDLEEARLFDMLVPMQYGGIQCSLPSYFEATMELGRGDGSVAWTVALLSASTWMMTTFFPEHVLDEVFSGGKFRTAGVLAPQKVKTRRIDGGIMIEEGSWSFNTGVYHAHWDLLGVPIVDEAGQSIGNASALVPVSQIALSHDWDAIGLRATGSTSVTAKDVFVPNERIVPLSRVLSEDYASAHLRHEPLYRLPLVPFLATNLVFPTLGMAKTALELFLKKARHRSIPYTFYQKQDEAAVTHLRAGEASAKIEAAELMLRHSMEMLESAASSNVKMTTAQRAHIWRNAGAANRLIWEAVDLLAWASGASFVHDKNAMSRIWRDVRVASLHGGLNPDTTMEIFGAALLGKRPNSSLV